MLETIETSNLIAMSVEQASQVSSLSKPFLRNEIRAGKLKVKRCGRRVLILKSDFMDYLNEGENGEQNQGDLALEVENFSPDNSQQPNSIVAAR